MAIDGTPPFKLPNGAQPIILNDFDLLTSVQSTQPGTGPFTVPAGHRLVITGAHISWGESSATPPANGREILIQVDSIENDARGSGVLRTILGICVPPTQFEEQTGTVTNLAIPVRGGTAVRVSITGTSPFVTGTTAQVIIVWGWLETQTG